MNDFEDSRLWKAAFLQKRASASERNATTTLRTAYLEMRKKVTILVSQIAHDLRHFTVHDVSHLDALWDLASLIAGQRISLNPLEAFVFGGAVLTHDAGMSLAAYSNGIVDLRKHPKWKDSVYIAEKQELGRAPSREEMDQPDTKTEHAAIEYLLRELHAEQAERLPSICWQADRGERYYLIDNPDLRSSLAPIIGKIAFSHWWPVSRLKEEFPKRLGAPIDLPPSWQIDARKIACLLRLADAAHLDWRRAPGFLRAMLRPTAGAAEHWIFQERLNQPMLEEDRLVFTAGTAFERQDARAWWLCLRVVRMLEGELRGVDDLLADLGEDRFIAKTVKGAEDAQRFAQLVPTKGWLPVEAKLQVTDVAALVKRLGGEELYGENPTVPVRELIQNAADAIRARRFLNNKPSWVGEITVRLGENEESDWLKIEDNGIGMSAAVLTGPFLDFGKSYWGSLLMTAEHPGLLSSGFESTGKYGIGFFSSFMLGDCVTVTTLPFGDSSQNTNVLEFQAGLNEQPLLRRADVDERLPSAGTIVRIQLTKRAREEGGILYRKNVFGPATRHLSELLSWLCPTLDVNVYAHEWSTKPELVVGADDWLKMSGAKLLERTGSSYSRRKFVGRNLRVIRAPNGDIVGRAGVVPYQYGSAEEGGEGIVTVGGFRTTELVGIAGVLKGISKRASRDNAEVVVEPEQLQKWANGQVKLVQREFERLGDQAFCAVVIELCGGSANALKIVRWGDKWFSSDELAEIKNLPLSILLIDEGDVREVEERAGSLKLRKEVFVTSVGIVASSIYASEWNSWPRSFLPRNRRNPIRELVRRGLAKAWAVGQDEVKVGHISPVRIGDSEYDDVNTSADYFLHPSQDDFDEEG
jgi:hypothetical protein